MGTERTLDDVRAKLASYDELKDEAKRLILLKLKELESEQRRLYAELVALGFTEYADRAPAAKPKRQDSEETRRRKRESAIRRHERGKAAPELVAQ